MITVSRFYAGIIFVLLLASSAESVAQAHWTKLLDAPCYGFSANPLNPRTLYVGGGARAFYRSYDAGLSWDTIYVEFQGSGEEFLNVVVHPLDTNIIIIGGSRFGTIRRSTDRGSTWDIVLPPTSGHTFNGESIIVDRSDRERVYAADFNNGVIYRSTNRGRDWDSLSVLPLDSSGTHTFQNQPCSLTQRADSTNIFFAGCLRSNVFRSDDFGKTWSFVSKLRTALLDEPELPQLHFSSVNPLVGYAISSYFFYQARPNGGFYKTVDGGAHWNIERFTDTAFWCMTTRPTPDLKGDDIVLGGFTEYFSGDSIVPGSKIILRSIDNGKSWWNYQTRVPWGDGIDNSILTMRFVGQFYSTQKLYASAVSGLYVLGPEGLNDAEDRSLGHAPTQSISIYAGTDILIEWQPGGLQPASHATLRIVDALGRVMHSVTSSEPSQGLRCSAGRETWANGVYYAIVHCGSQQYTRAFIVQD